MDEKNIEESKKLEEKTSIPDAPQDKKNAEESKLEGDESKKPKDNSEENDYKAMLEEEQERRKKAEEKVVKLKKEIKGKDKEEEEEEEDDIDERISSIVEEKVSSFKNKFKEEIISSEVDDLLGELSTNKDEKELIKYYYDNVLQKSGYSRASIREDLINAKVLANKNKIIKTNKELSEAFKSKLTLSNSPSFNSNSRETESELKLNDKEQKLLERFGAVDRFKKEIKN